MTLLFRVAPGVPLDVGGSKKQQGLAGNARTLLLTIAPILGGYAAPTVRDQDCPRHEQCDARSR